MKVKLLSLFDGSGGFPLAGAMCDIIPVAASEVEPYPIAVTKSRFPNMKHLGDISKINGAEIEPVDIITFGSPCQDMSVAGKRAGLKHEDNGDDETTRSGLFMEAVRIIKEMRGATNGEYPRFAVWENVPGAFSSNKGEDFRLVLEELIKIAEPTAVMPEVPKKGWAYADSYIGDGWSIAYRVFDAQYIRTAQRRRRIYLVLDLGGQCARKILFEREGWRGYFTESRTKGQGVATDAQGSVGADDRARTVCYGISSYDSNAMKSSNPNSGIYEADTSRTLDLNGGNPACNQGGIAVVEPAYGFPLGFRPENVRCYEEAATTLCNGTRAGFCNGVVYSVENHPADSRVDLDESGKVQTLTSRMGTGGGNVPMVMEEKPVICLQGNGIDRADTAGCNGRGWKEDTSYTLNTIDRPAVVNAVDQGGGKSQANVTEDLSPTLTCTHGGEPAIAIDRAFFNQGKNALYEPQTYEDGTNPTLVAKGPSAVCTRYIVRRLTPTECARLQGFSDKWGHIDHKDDFTDEEYKFWLNVRNTHAEINGREVKDYTKKQMLTWYNKLHTDSAEYKLWGNGIALPCALYVMQGIEDVLKGEANDSIRLHTEDGQIR